MNASSIDLSSAVTFMPALAFARPIWAAIFISYCTALISSAGRSALVPAAIAAAIFATIPLFLAAARPAIRLCRIASDSMNLLAAAWPDFFSVACEPLMIAVAASCPVTTATSAARRHPRRIMADGSDRMGGEVCLLWGLGVRALHLYNYTVPYQVQVSVYK